MCESILAFYGGGWCPLDGASFDFKIFKILTDDAAASSARCPICQKMQGLQEKQVLSKILNRIHTTSEAVFKESIPLSIPWWGLCRFDTPDQSQLYMHSTMVSTCIIPREKNMYEACIS